MTEKKPDITMTSCQSSAIRAHGYDAATKTLRLAFANGGAYRYLEVPPAIAAGIKDAKSVGRYVASNVTGKFKTVKD